MAKMISKIRGLFRFSPKGEKYLVIYVIVYIFQMQVEYMMRVNIGKDVAWL